MRQNPQTGEKRAKEPKLMKEKTRQDSSNSKESPNEKDQSSTQQKPQQNKSNQSSDNRQSTQNKSNQTQSTRPQNNGNSGNQNASSGQNTQNKIITIKILKAQKGLIRNNLKILESSSCDYS